jgi:hypothetical protein
MPAKDDAISGMRREQPSVQPSPLPPVSGEEACPEPRARGPAETRGTGRVEPLTETLFSMEEPWRGRFLKLVANLATKWSWNGQRPTRAEITGWLNADPELYEHVELLLDTWRGPAR